MERIDLSVVCDICHFQSGVMYCQSDRPISPAFLEICRNLKWLDCQQLGWTNHTSKVLCPACSAKLPKLTLVKG